MRLIRYAVVNKNTYKAVFSSNSESKCIEYLETLENKANFYIGHRWFSA